MHCDTLVDFSNHPPFRSSRHDMIGNQLLFSYVPVPSWLVDKSRIATKIKRASTDSELVFFETNPSRTCSNCHYVIDNSDVQHEWPGLPKGVKFDPSDPEIIWHLLTKAGVGNLNPHPFINEFIPTVNEEDGICYTHPRKLPGVKQDGSISHFFHRAIKAYNTGTRKRRKIQDGDFGDVRWHKTGRTKPVTLDGVRRGCKKIMVLYVSPAKGGKAEKTNWVMHQYHLGTQEDEKEGEYVVSKIFYQQQQLVKPNAKNEQGEFLEDFCAIPTTKIDPVTPKSMTTEVSHTERQSLSSDAVYESVGHLAQDQEVGFIPDDMISTLEVPDVHDPMISENSALITSGNHGDQVPNVQHNAISENNRSELNVLDNHGDQVHNVQHTVISENNCSELNVLDNHGDQVHNVQGAVILENSSPTLISSEDHDDQAGDKNDYEAGEDSKWWDSESQHLLSSQQLVEALSLCDELLASQSPKKESMDTDINQQEMKSKPKLSDYVHLGTNQFKEDLEKCQSIVSDPPNLDLDSIPDVQLSQLEFASEDSYIAWGGSKAGCEGTSDLNYENFSAEASLHSQR
ncbi:hypothetical protein LIER_35750 [Lithospermum erythrorhizon]|uniref:NAC domain-containing protein n=1 Tax=Lithospermum erythrorhizon TaxID=34254 RepID=A0AAV3NWX9_LITER